MTFLLNQCSTCLALSRYSGKLQKLNLSSCPAITDQALKALADGCPHLVHIDLSWCELISQNGSFSSLCNLKRVVKPFFYDQLFIVGVEVLAKGCPGLMTFHCRGCKLIGDDALTFLANYCTRLQNVNIQCCVVSTNDPSY